MFLPRLLTAAAIAALFAAPAIAGPDPTQPVEPMNPPADARAPDTQLMTTPSVEDAAAPASATAVDPSAPAVVLGNSPTPPDQAWRLKAGDPSVVSNGPVPDTAENRARYGQPMSVTGRRTRPVGN